MTAWVNGFPKSGTHALIKACELLGVPATHHHEPWRKGLAVVGRPLLVQRDPRNIAISWLRHHGRPVTEGTVIKTIRHFDRAPLAQELAAYEPWRYRAETVRFEDLVSSVEVMRALATLFASEVDVDEAYAYLPGGTLTWTGQLSDWTAVWTPAIDRVWAEMDGPALLARWGYQ